MTSESKAFLKMVVNALRKRTTDTSGLITEVFCSCFASIIYRVSKVLAFKRFGSEYCYSTLHGYASSAGRYLGGIFSYASHTRNTGRLESLGTLSRGASNGESTDGDLCNSSIASPFRKLEICLSLVTLVEQARTLSRLSVKRTCGAGCLDSTSSKPVISSLVREAKQAKTHKIEGYMLCQVIFNSVHYV